MDPYLEKHWGDVHQRLVTYACDQLQEYLPESLRARMEERVYVEFDEPQRSLYPDVRVVESGQTGSTAAATLDTATAEPIVVPMPIEPLTESCIEIVDVASGHRLVTVIEVLSPANKSSSRGRRLYRKKQRELRKGKVSLVEIDLLRAGRRVLSVPTALIPRSHRSQYQVCVRRGWKVLEVEVYRVALREPLPTIRVPLRPDDVDVPLKLQALIEECYRKGRYDDLDYKQPPEPPLESEDAAWAEELLKSRGLR
jgi:hypothetical protein